ncbi:MAG: SH3 domain-containing protein [Spirochaetes bacterium]|nr:SH3 domain-containing protein [Spirochaetota bacterium]
MKLRILIAMAYAVVTCSLAAEGEFTPNQVIYATVSALRVRGTPTLEGKHIGSLAKGDSLRVVQVAGEAITVEGKTGRWVQFDHDGQMGFVFAGFLSADMPLVAHTPAEWKKIEAKNRQHTARRIKEAEDWAKAHPDDQNCTPPSCYSTEVFGWPQEYQKGCTARKLTAIKKLMQTKGIGAFEATNEYGDGYCIGWQQWEMIEINCSISGRKNMPQYPLK